MNDRPRAALLALGGGLRRVARGRGLALGVAGAAAVLAAAASAPLPEPSAAGIAEALSQAVGGAVAPDDVVWEPSGGALHDAVWGRGVAFLAVAPPGRDGVARRDVYRARMTVAPGGRAMRARAIARQTDTPLADEHDLLARDLSLAWLTRGVGGEHGATVLIARHTTRRERLLDAIVGSGLAPRTGLHAVLSRPVASLRAELRDEGLVFAFEEGGRTVAALVDPRAHVVQVDAADPRVSLVAVPADERRDPAWPWQVNRAPPAGPAPAPEGLAVDGDGVFPPAGATWEALLAPEVNVPGEVQPPAPVARATIDVDGDRVVLHAFDRRQLEARVIPGPAAPRARSGLPGSGTPAPHDAPRIVATATITPLGEAGGREEGRAIAPLGEHPAIAHDGAGALLLGALDAATAVSAVELPPSAVEPAAWCLAGPAVVVATSDRRSAASLERAVATLGCGPVTWVSDAHGEATPRVEPHDGNGAPRSFVAFLRRATFPDGRPERWTASPGRQPAPSFRPAVVETTRDVLGTTVRIVGFAPGRFGWAIRAGTDERSHRAGGRFPEALGALRPRALAAIGLGIGERRRPNGLTIGGSTGHRYAGRGAILAADDDGLRLVRSSDARGEPPGDATELPLTVEGGELTANARDRGLLHERGDLCVLSDGTTLVALARFDSHEAGADVLLRMGCEDVVALDRGNDVPALLDRASSADLPDAYPMSVLLALTPAG